jgi:ubiquitin-conjugating enzyme E2 O
MELRVGDRIFLKDAKGLPTTTHGQVGDATGVLNVQTFLVSQTSTELDVLWQDGSKETLRATEVIPYLNPDEYDCW